MTIQGNGMLNCEMQESQGGCYVLDPRCAKSRASRTAIRTKGYGEVSEGSNWGRKFLLGLVSTSITTAIVRYVDKHFAGGMIFREGTLFAQKGWHLTKEFLDLALRFAKKSIKLLTKQLEVFMKFAKQDSSKVLSVAVAIIAVASVVVGLIVVIIKRRNYRQAEYERNQYLDEINSGDDESSIKDSD